MKQLVFSTILSIIILVDAFAYNGGMGEPNNPYQIASKEDLLDIGADTDNYDKCFILTADVDMENQIFTRAIIAPDTSTSDGFQGISFTGTFDGNGYKIINYTINNGVRYIGLFGQINSGGSVSNLGLENVDIKGYYYVGDLAGSNIDGIITNCYSIGRTVGSSQSRYIGGLVGENGGSMSNCFSMYQIRTYQEVDNSSPVDYISGYSYVGGLVGRNYGSMCNCYSTAAVGGGSTSFGGLVGFNSGTIRNCFATGTASGGSSVGGFVGSNVGNIINCYSTGQVNGSHLLIGGLVGRNSGSISKCYSTGVTSGSSISQWVGGLVGDNDSGGSISNCFTTGAVNVSANGEYVGGLVGGNYNSSISNCYSISPVSGSNYVGGLVGRVWYGSSIINCYSTGQVNGSTNVGGLVGVTENDSNTLNSFWDRETSGLSTSSGGTDMSTGQMKILSTFTSEPARWDFTNETDNGTNDYWRLCFDGISYPHLNWESIDGDFVCPDCVDSEDLGYFAERWLEINCVLSNNYCGGTNMNDDGSIDFKDFALFAKNWLGEQ